MFGRTSAVLVTFAGLTLSLPAEDPVTNAIEALRQKRGQVIARENDITVRYLQGVLNQRKSERNTAEIERLELLIEQLQEENQLLRSKGDKRALAPSNEKQLRAYLIGTAWSFSGSAKNGLEFMADGAFKGKNESFQYAIIGPKRVTIIWSPTSRVDCEINDEGNTLTELAGAHGVLKRVR